MLVDRKTALHLRAQAIIFHALFLGLVVVLAYLSTQYSADLDWTAAKRNSLSEASAALLTKLPGPVTVTAFVTENPGRRELVRKVIGRYQALKPDLTLELIDPNTAPDRVRELGIGSDGTLLFGMAGRTEKVAPDFRGDYSESEITNALQRLARGGERYLAFLDGHGERKHDGEANHDLGSFGKLLVARGLKLTALNLASAQRVPDNTALLVVAGPQTALLPLERDLIVQHLARGGNLLLLADPELTTEVAPITAALGLTLLPGVIVDPRAQVLGSPDPRLVVVDRYQPAPFTRDFDVMTVFPVATGIEFSELHDGYAVRPFAASIPQAWLESSPVSGVVRFDAGPDREGPVTLGVYALRSVPGAAGAPAREQRVAVLADGDFLSNQFAGNGGNLELGLNLVSWLAQDDDFINVHVTDTPDATLVLSEAALLTISFGFLLGLPLLLIALGVTIWWRRRRA